MPDDQELWDKIRGGDIDAFEGFYYQQAARLHRFLSRYLGDPTTAEDIAQEAFLQLWRRPDGFNPTRGTLKAYLFGIAAKRAADWCRHCPPESAALVDHAALRSEAAMLISDALGRLEPEVRGLLWLREVEGHSYSELAEILDIPTGTVKSRLFAAREELRRVWKAEAT